jgi:hypothetical protein
MANNRIAVLVALEGSDDGLKRALTSAQQSLGELAANAKTAGEKAAAGMAEVKAGMSAFGDQVSSAKSQLLAFLSINWAAGKLQEVVQIADAWNMMATRLKLATIGQQEYAVAQKALFEIAQRIGVPIQETATLYGKLQQARSHARLARCAPCTDCWRAPVALGSGATSSFTRLWLMDLGHNYLVAH